MAEPPVRGPVLDRFWSLLASRARSVLMLDFDGTLAPFRVDRSRAFPYPGVEEALDRLMEATPTRVVIVSGRWTRDLLELLRLRRLPELWGSHGLERRMADGTLVQQDPGEEVTRFLDEAHAWAVSTGYAANSERKPGCLALHWRGLPAGQAELMRRDATEAWSMSGFPSGLALVEFDGGLELRAKGHDKGDAVRAVLAEEGENVAAAYLGDDLTDEDAFRAIRGRGLSVLVRPDARPTDADLWIKPPGELLDFLQRWAEVLDRNEVRGSRGGS